MSGPTQFADAQPKAVMRRTSSPGSSSFGAQGGWYTVLPRTQISSLSFPAEDTSRMFARLANPASRRANTPT